MSNLEEKFQLFLKEARSSDTTQSGNAIPQRNPLPKPEIKGESKKNFWWLKGATKIDSISTEVPANEIDLKQTAISTQSSVSSSMAEFLQREGICKDTNIVSRNAEENQVIADKLPSVCGESVATKADYSDDFTDDDISSIMDQLSQLAGSGGDDSGRSLGDILKEAEEVVRNSSKNHTGNKGSTDRSPPPPLLKPESHLTINLTEKSDADDSEDSGGVYVRRERIASRNNSGASKNEAAVKMPFDENIVSHADEIFKQIELEVKNKIAASKDKQATSQIKLGNIFQQQSTGPFSSTEAKKVSNPSAALNNQPTSSDDAVKLAEKPRNSFSPLRGEPLSIVIEESASEASSSVEADLAAGNSKQAKESLSEKLGQGKDINDQNTTQQLEDKLAKEKKANEKLKVEMNSKVEDLKKQIELLKCKSQEKRFALEKDVSILKATLAGYEKKAVVHDEMGGGDCKRVNPASNQRLRLLEDEMQKQEQLIIVYQEENVKLCQDVKRLKQELKAKDSQLDENLPLSARRITVAEASEKEILAEKLKGKDVHIGQLTATVEAMQKDKIHFEESIVDLKSKNVQMLDEIGKYKKVINDLKSKDNSQSVALLQKELETQKADSAKKAAEIDRLHRDLRRTSGELESRKLAAKAANIESQKKTDSLDEKLRELQIELDEERAFSEEERAKHSKDEQKIDELTTKLKEMEQLMKKRPSSMPGPAVSHVSEGADLRKMSDSPKVKFLEDRIQQLEAELESAKSVLDSGFEGIQVQYKSLKDKYDLNTAQLTSDLAAWKKEAAAWKEAAKNSNAEVDVNKQLKEYAVSQRVAKPLLFANAIAVKEDAHLIATIRGLRNELQAKDKLIRGLEKKLGDSVKTNKRLQTEREKVLAQPVVTKVAVPPLPFRATKRAVEETRELQLEFHPYQERQKELEHAISQLKDKIRIKDDQIDLFTIELRDASERRLRDLEELQEEHDVEIAQLMSESSSKHFHNRYSELEGKVHNQEQIINNLKEQLKALDEHRAENLVLKVEREHLEKNLKEANKKMSFMRQSQSPDQSHYESLLDKIADLELRHESREQNLQAVVRDLLRSKSEQGDGTLVTLREQLTQKNRELCFYKSEMNKIIGKVAYLENELIGQAPKSKR